MNVSKRPIMPSKAPLIQGGGALVGLQAPIGIQLNAADDLVLHSKAKVVDAAQGEVGSQWRHLAMNVGIEFLGNVTFWFVVGVVTKLYPQTSHLSGLTVGWVLAGSAALLSLLAAPHVLLVLNPAISAVLTLIHWCLKARLASDKDKDGLTWKSVGNDIVVLLFVVAAQILGSLVGHVASAINFLDGTTDVAFVMSAPHFGLAAWVAIPSYATGFQVAVSEGVGTMLITLSVLVVYGASHFKDKAVIAATLRGSMLFAVTALYYPISGASINPFRFLWPYVLRGTTFSAEVPLAYVLAPFAGAFLGGFVFLVWIVLTTTASAEAGDKNANTAADSKPLLKTRPAEPAPDAPTMESRMGRSMMPAGLPAFAANPAIRL